jgi:hypothetical protein
MHGSKRALTLTRKSWLSYLRSCPMRDVPKFHFSGSAHAVGGHVFVN